ncbi:hypothetical protein N0V82_008438 [Gnomoniopsis sp. IMI 355080]|nr:hypothetical protein N0V82_008438 [Gnomoniopsis sp. IMI 355080]
MAANLQSTPIFRTTHLGYQGGMQSLIVHFSDATTLLNLRALCKNSEETAISYLPLADVRLEVAANMGNTQLILAKIVRRDSYFTALLVAAAGGISNTECGHSCGNPASSTHPFTECIRVANYQGGACATCIWKSHAARC